MDKELHSVSSLSGVVRPASPPKKEHSLAEKKATLLEVHTSLADAPEKRPLAAKAPPGPGTTAAEAAAAEEGALSSTGEPASAGD